MRHCDVSLQQYEAYVVPVHGHEIVAAKRDIDCCMHTVEEKKVPGMKVFSYMTATFAGVPWSRSSSVLVAEDCVILGCLWK